MAVRIPTKGAWTNVVSEGDTFSLRELYNLIDCEHIEIVYLNHEIMMILDESGKIKNKDINASATHLFLMFHPEVNDIIVGNVIVAHVSEVE